MAKTYEEGYRDGFKDGFNEGKIVIRYYSGKRRVEKREFTPKTLADYVAELTKGESNHL